MIPKSEIDNLIDLALKSIETVDVLARNPSAPLLHFTDADGLIGIVRTKQLWANRATCMNDASELAYGKNLGKSIVEAHVRDERNSGAAAIWSVAHATFADVPEPKDLAPLYFDAFVASFCAHADKSVHWLHYGRSGHGYAVAIDFGALDYTGWSLVPVVYEIADQQRILESLYGGIQHNAATLMHANGGTWDEKDLALLVYVAGHLIFDVTRAIAPCFKDPCFSAEEEWRLFRTWVEGRVAEEGKFPLKFRAKQGRIVPYTEFALAPQALKKVVTGYQVPDHPAHQSIRFLLQENGIDPACCAIEHSRVPVQGAA